jgi:Zn-dependent peptidase ImmA (M78 family)
MVGQRAAQALRFELGLGLAPIDIYDVIERRGVALAFRDLGGDDGRYVFHNGKALILVSSTCGEASRQRFTAAHELGHHELHRFDANGEVETVLIDKVVGRSGGDPREQAANSFAASLLLPREALQQIFPERAQVSVEQVVELMDRFGLSYSATVYRLHNTDRISAARRDALLQEGDGQVHRLSIRDEVPQGAQPPRELERHLAKLYRAGLVPAERLSEVLGRPPEAIVTTYGEPEQPGTDVDDLLAEIEGTEA